MKGIWEYELLYPYDFLIPSITYKNGTEHIFLDFKPRRSKHLMIRGSDFYAIYDFDTCLWSKDWDKAIDILDQITLDLTKRYSEDNPQNRVKPMIIGQTSTKRIDAWNKFCKQQMRDNWHPLDNTVIFQNTEVKREDYASFKLPYNLAEGSIENYEKMFTPLFDAPEFRKLEWCTGAIIAGASKHTQKMFVLYGTGGSGKSTWLDLQSLYIFSCKQGNKNAQVPGYASTTSVKDLCNGRPFGLETMKDGPLISIDDDAKLDKLEDNTLLNSVVSHAVLPVNTKHKSIFEQAFYTTVCVGTNTPIQISDAKSGLIRRVIDVVPTGYHHPYKTYMKLKEGMKYEIGAIAYHCLKVFEELGEDYYETYIPQRMLQATNYFYDFLDDSYDWFREKDSVYLFEVWKRYQEYATNSNLKYTMNKLMVKNQLKDYFTSYTKDGHIEGKHANDIYKGFKYWTFGYEKKEEPKEEVKDEGTLENNGWLRFDREPVDRSSYFDIFCTDCPAQLASKNEKPLKPWSEVTTYLRDIDPHEVHYVKVPPNHIVIDFDLKDETGQKSFLLNWKAASRFPKTYAELSKSGAGIHLHYLYSGDPERLARLFDKDIEIKVFKGGASLRRRLSRCNDIPISTISAGLPLKEVRKVVDWDGVKNEKMLRRMIIKNLNKEYHANTKPSIDYIYDLLKQAYEGGVAYDVSDLEPKVIAFAGKSSNQATYCLKKCTEMHFSSDEPSRNQDDGDGPLIFFDLEVMPNLFVVCWKAENDGKVTKMINPSSRDIEHIFRYRLIGFNNRKYDNHILWAASMGYSVEQLYKLSQRIINEHTGFFGEAYNLSYTDVYDFASAAHKKSLKKFEIELGIHHQELGLPWDKPVPEELWDLVAEYCCNDVMATEAVFHHLKGDWKARQIVAELSGLTVNDTTNQHSTRIIFGDDPNPQSQFIYTDLSELFPGYKFEFVPEKKRFVSFYRGEDPGEGGYVYAEPGMYTDTVVLDVASMHPSSIEALNLFGDMYTSRFVDIKNARVLIKHEEWDEARKILEGRLAPYLDDEDLAVDLSSALKTVINAVYGQTAAKFPNKFKDERNVDNIVAKRGALFMINLKHAVQERGFTVAHIKTDSIKIPNATPEIIQFVMDYGQQYGYTFEHESTYEKMCLVNNAVYIAKYASEDWCQHKYGYLPGNNAKAIKKNKLWDATGAQFAQPYVFKTLFSHEELAFSDYCETKSTTSALYLDMNEGMADVTMAEKKLDKLKKDWKKKHASGEVDFGLTFDNDPLILRRKKELEDEIASGHNYRFVGRVGNFVPVKTGGGWLMRQNGDSFAFATGSSGHRWIEAEEYDVSDISNIDISYHEKLVDEAIESMARFGDVEWFLSSDAWEPLPDFMNIPENAGEEIPFEAA